VLDDVPIPPAPLAPLKRHIEEVASAPLFGIDDEAWLPHEVLRPWSGGRFQRKRAGEV
jgi:hypothetical protein